MKVEFVHLFEEADGIQQDGGTKRAASDNHAEKTTRVSPRANEEWQKGLQSGLDGMKPLSGMSVAKKGIRTLLEPFKTIPAVNHTIHEQIQLHAMIAALPAISGHLSCCRKVGEERVL
jgi:hypothetical protein